MTLTREELTAALEAATRDLPPHEKVAVAERVAIEIGRANRRGRYPTPGALAHNIDPLITVETPALELIDAELVAATERMEQGESVRLGIFAPPQEGKSRRVTIAWPLWLLLRNPNLRIALVSFELETAAAFSSPVRNFIAEHGSGTPLNPRPLADDLLGITLRGDSTSRSRFNLAGHTGSVLALGMKGGLVGKPADVLIIDDPYKSREQADNPKHRATVEDWYRNVAVPRLPTAGIVALVQTRWHPADLAGYVLAEEQALPPEQRRWRFVSIPAQAERPPVDPEARRGWLPDALARDPGTYLISARGRTPEDWAARRAEVGEMVWGSLYQQHPTPPEGAVFDYAHIARNRRPHDFTTTPARRAVAVDTSAGGADEAGILAGYRGTDSRVYITHDRSGVMSSAAWARTAWLLAVDTHADDLVWEANLAGPTMRTELTNAWRRIVAQIRLLRKIADDDLSRRVGVLLANPSGNGHRPDRALVLGLAARRWAAAEQQLPEAEVQATPEDVAQFGEIADRLDGPLAHVLETPPARLIPVHATEGKRIRATPVAVAYETNRVSHVGVLPEYEQELTHWIEGHASPNRLDGGVWLVTHLLAAARRASTTTAAGQQLPGPRS
jgi:hypothetical protein